MKQQVSSCREELNFLFNLEFLGIKPGLERISHFSSTLNHPHKHFKSIHIAGTNGKGSVAAILCSLLKEAGYRTGLYISPHLVSFNERITVNSEPIPDEKIREFISKNRQFIEKIGLTFFETATAMALDYFREAGVEIAVVEAGMGGKWDATNIVNPVISVITSVGWDHMEFLGNTIAEIAHDKSHIIKPGVCAVVARQDAEIEEIMASRCMSVGAEFHPVSGEADYHVKGVKAGGIEFDYRDTAGELRGLKIGLTGRHQADNAATAILAFRLFEEKAGDLLRKLSDGRYQNALSGVVHPGRFEVVRTEPGLLILDGAHNLPGVKALSAAIKEIYGTIKFQIIFGVKNDKDFASMLEILKPHMEVCIVTGASAASAMAPRILKEYCAAKNINAIFAKDIKEAFMKIPCKQAPILVTGSLYLVGDALSFLKYSNLG